MARCSLVTDSLDHGNPKFQSFPILAHLLIKSPGMMRVPLHEYPWVKSKLLFAGEDVDLPWQPLADQPGGLVDQVLEQVTRENRTNTFFSKSLEVGRGLLQLAKAS